MTVISLANSRGRHAARSGLPQAPREGVSGTPPTALRLTPNPAFQWRAAPEKNSI